MSISVDAALETNCCCTTLGLEKNLAVVRFRGNIVRLQTNHLPLAHVHGVNTLVVSSLGGDMLLRIPTLFLISHMN